MATVQEVFDCAMALIDEVDPATGSTDTADTAEYKARTLPIVNALAIECKYYSQNLYNTELYSDQHQTVLLLEPTEHWPAVNFASNIQLNDKIARAVLPYGLAAQLLMGEDAVAANFLQQRYEDLRAMLKMEKAEKPVVSSLIYDVYGVRQEEADWNREW